MRSFMPQYDNNGIRELYTGIAGTTNGTHIRASGFSVGIFQVTGTFVGTISPMQTIDGTLWNTLTVQNMNTQTTGTLITGTGMYKADVAGLGSVRFPVTAYTSGTMNTYGVMSEAPFGPLITSSSSSGGGGTAEGGTAGTASGNLVMFRGTGGTFTIAGTGAGLPVTQQTLLAGEDLTNNRINVGLNVSYANNILSIGTAGTVAIGTLVAAPGAGTSIYVTGFSITPDSSALGTAEVCLSFGTAQTGTAVLFRGVLNTLTSNPVINNYSFPVNAGITNAPLTYLLISGAGSIAWNANYIVHS